MNDIKYFGMLENMRTDLGLFELDPLIQEPINALKYLSAHSKLDSFRCPAVKKYLENVYYICSPLDFTIFNLGDSKFKIENDKSNKSDLSSFLFVSYPETKTLNNLPVLTIHLQYFFISSNKDTYMEVIDPPLQTLPLTNICGEYNIGRWVRPTNFSFFLDPSCKSISFQRGDPLYAVRFRTDKKIKLHNIIDDDERTKILNEQQKAVSLKKWYPNISLDESYELFKNRIKSILK